MVSRIARAIYFALVTLSVAGVTQTAAADPAATDVDDADMRFFEQRIRPVLAQQCYECHSAGGSDVKGGLYLDTRKALRRGGESGPSIVPGEPENSLLYQALAYHGDVKMPPDNKLEDRIIDDFAEWIRRGAVDPRAGDRPVPEPIGGDVGAEALWALSPMSAPPPPTDLPAPADAEPWPSSDIDRFILARLVNADLPPAPRAGRRTLIRRAYFDLIGLPPTPDEVQAFLDDDSPDAFKKVVDRLLASPRFGERWGRHWLDIARFAESSGGSRSRVFPNAWRFRDYVIESLNEDVPYDQFIIEQLAGDLLPYETDAQRRRQLIATGFLALGPKNLDAQDKALQRMDVVDEQLDSMGQAVMGMTFGCARCHDHMFDPISIEEYYAMAGFFRSARTLTPGNINGVVHSDLPLNPETEQAHVQWETKEAQLAASLEEARRRDRELKARFGVQMAKGPFPLTALDGIVVDNSGANTVGRWPTSTHSPNHVHENYQHDDNAGKGEYTITYIPEFPESAEYEVRLAYNHAASRASNVPVTIQHAEGRTVVHVDQTQQPPIDGIFVSLGRFRFEEGQDGSVTLSNEGTQGYVIADAVQFVRVGRIAEAAEPDADERDELAEAAGKVASLEAELQAHRDDRPATPRAMTVHDQDVGDSPVHIRGEVGRLGKRVPRGFPEAIAVDADFTIPDDQSGRLQLAQWLVEPDHPLTSRVMVNRIWGHLIGRPIVPTPDNFGSRGGQPSHPELLDHLASRFIDDGYSIKSLIRAIMLTSTYQMATVHDEQAASVDLDNRLLWSAHTRRLDAEAIRDAMLAVSGDLDLTMFGDTLEGRTGDRDDYSPDSNRRSIYLPVFRSALPEFMEAFDVADPNLVVGRRSVSTVPTQALYLLNSPFVHERAASLAQRVTGRDGDDEARVRWLYELLLGRLPHDGEMAIALDLLSYAGDDHEQRLTAYRELSHALLASLEFRFLN